MCESLNYPHADGLQQALRTLKLLEKHHENLAQLLKFRISHPQSLEATSSEPNVAEQGAVSSPSPLSREISSYRSAPPNPLSPHPPQREISSSIASNLASARGIPSSRQRKSAPASPSVLQYTENRVLSPSSKSRPGETAKAPDHAFPPENVQGAQKQLSLKVSAAESAKSSSLAQPATNTKLTEDSPSSRNDEPFQRFYATVESLFSTLSAPLAFAGLPLNIGEPAISPPNPSTSAQTKTEEQQPPPTDPEFSKIFSKAALRALREEHGGAATGGPFNGAESFYVVPTTGGTISYAEILARAQQDATRHSNKITKSYNPSNSDEQLDDEFVDARETPQSTSPVSSRRPKPGTKTMEELQLENEALRALADNVCRRLFEFEMGAQTSSLALQRSIRAMQSSSGTGHAGATVNDANSGKIAELEGQLAKLKREAERMEKENEKLKNVVVRYRERWEKIKEGAKARREPTGDGGG